MAFIAISTENPTGRRPLNLMARNQGMGWLGDLGATPGDYDNNQPLLNQLVAMGAITQQNANDIWNGQASLDDMAVNMTMINQALQMIGQAGTPAPAPVPGLQVPSGPQAQVVPYTPTPATRPPIAPAAPATPAQSPSGSSLLYTAAWSTAVANLFVSANDAIASLTQSLPSYGMSVAGSSVAAANPLAATIQVRVLDSIGHQQLNDAKSVLDALMTHIVGQNLKGTQIALVATPGQALPAGTPGLPGTGQSISTFLESNMGLVAGVLIAIVVLPALIKKL